MLGLLLVLGDLDHAKYLDASSVTNRQFGTYNYLPPEYYDDDIDYKNESFDIW